MNRLIPNIFTLLNLFLGCMAIVEVMQPGLVMSTDGSGVISVPERIYVASIYIGCAALVDFLDGFVARLLKTPSELGKQLDSLADVVSFGVVPGLIAFQFLRLSYASDKDGLDTSIAYLMPAFLIPCAGAFRLARFNIDTSQSYGFKGVPIPAAGLLVASFPLIYWYSNESWAINLMVNKWFWYALIIGISFLMISTLPMMALKFKSASLKDNWPKILLVVIAALAALLFQWMAVPLVFVVYVILSLVLKQKEV